MTDHLHVDESVTEVDAAPFAVVTVDIDHLDADGLAEDLFGEILARLCVESLPLLGRVNSGQSNLAPRLQSNATAHANVRRATEWDSVCRIATKSKKCPHLDSNTP